MPQMQQNGINEVSWIIKWVSQLQLADRLRFSVEHGTPLGQTQCTWNVSSISSLASLTSHRIVGWWLVHFLYGKSSIRIGRVRKSTLISRWCEVPTRIGANVSRVDPSKHTDGLLVGRSTWYARKEIKHLPFLQHIFCSFSLSTAFL